ncbi:beta-N-acetylhexosaminidase [Zhouia sp. PK063]|uniref:beta-N-acetylhexosaminidase n=1 Tax=Zhouia sp. PK063 TaxID=3373602 RepID=UPI0037A1F2E5
MKKITCLSFTLLLGMFFIHAQDLKNKYDLIPWPSTITAQQGQLVLTPDFKLNITGDYNNRIYTGASSFLRRLSDKTGIFIDQGFATDKNEFPEAIFQIEIDHEGKLQLHEEESYTLTITPSKITLKSATDLGALHGLETLLQLVTYTNTQYYFPTVTINDKPRFAWRGLMMDVARHFQPIDVVKRNIDALAAAKMNVFHWHLSDDQGFRVEIKSLPRLQEYASDGMFYTQNQIKDVVAYAEKRGIRVIPELDVPGHATAIVTAYPEIASKDTTYNIERYSGIFDPTLDPTNDKTYEVLEKIIGEMAPLFPDPYFHIGGDENKGKQWDANKKIQQFMKDHQLKSNHELQNYFNIKLQKILKEHGKIMMGWDEIFQPELPKDVVIHSWRGKEAMVEAAKKGYKTVLSNGYYIDLLEPMKKHYLNDPIEENNPLTPEQTKNILGGEATMWSELVTPLTIDSRIWPRTAAIAERLWSPKNVNDYDNMVKRLQQFNLDLELLGITHLRNKDVILRNIANSEYIDPLKILSNVCEPLKAYTRNKGGKEYKTYSPFALFADACVVDAKDAVIFHNAVDSYLQQKSKENKEKILYYLQLWTNNYSSLKQMPHNPTLEKIMPLAQRLSEVSSSLLERMQGKRVKMNESDFNTLKPAVEDVELAVTGDLLRLFNSL